MNGVICVSVLLVPVFVLFCLSYLLLLASSYLSVISIFLRLFFDGGCVFVTMEGAQDASDFASSLFVFESVVVVVVVRDRVVVRLLFLCGCSSTRHNNVEVVGEGICYCVIVRRGDVVRTEGLFFLCLVSVYRLLVPVEFVVTASP